MEDLSEANGISKSNPRWWSAPPAIMSYGVALLSVTVALIISRVLDVYLVTAPASLFLCAIMFSAWFGGVRPGLLAVALSCLTFLYYFVTPINSLAVEINEIPRVIIFVLSAFFVGSLSAAQRRATESLRGARDDLSRTVKELSVINERLQTEDNERKRAEDVLREQASLLDLTHDSVFVRDMKAVITYWNRGAANLYGWTREEALGKISHQLMQTVFPAPLAEIDAELLASGRWEGELIHSKRDGSQVVVASRWAVRLDPRGKPLAILETNNDITSSKEAAQALQQQANLLEQTHDAIFIWEFPSTIVYWNRGAEKLYGFSRKEAIGRASHELLQTQHPLGVSALEAALEREGEWTGELTHATRDGRKIIVESRHVLMRESDGRRLVLETNRDITDRKRAEAELREAQADLTHANRVTTMGELTASLAHEVNQPITAAVTNANTCVRWLAGDTPNIEEAREAAIRSAKDGMRAADIISRIRLLFKKGTPERKLVDVNEIIREMVILLRGEATRFSISIRTEVAKDLPQLKGDRVQLQQVMLNLMINSMDAMKDVDGTRELTIRSQGAEDDELLISVSDTGVGLPPQVDRIFNAFVTTKLHGTGMGLSISRSIIESHGGRLWAADNSTRGATFYIALPTKDEAH